METYGYGGEFSSDEDIDLRAEKISPPHMNKPTRQQIEETIEKIKRLPIDQDVAIPDDMLAGLLDYYKTQRGPIVNSTRNLYQKIVLRLIRSSLVQLNADASDNGLKDVNGASKNDLNGINNNNNGVTGKHAPQAADSFSSDEDDIILVPSRKMGQDKFLGNVDGDKEVQMDVDPEILQNNKSNQIDGSTEEDSNATESSESEESDSELEVTPIKTPATMQKAADIVTPLTGKTKHQEPASKRQPLAQSTPKEVAESSKKPFTRSQRLAAARAAAAQNNVSFTEPSNQAAVVSNSGLSRGKVLFFAVAIMAVLIAFALYYAKINVVKSTGTLPSLKISF